MVKMHKILFLMTLILGSLITVSASTWLGIWLGLEINLLSMIPLMSQINTPLSSEASIKYFVTQALASTFLMVAIITSGLITETIKTIMIESVMFTKMGAAPFHFWFPEVMEGLTWINSLILMTWQKLAPMVILMYMSLIPSFTVMIIITSMAVSGLIGINQTSLRKIMAFSSINHIGWMIASILFMNSAWLLYFSIYSIITFSILSLFKNNSMFHIKQILSSNPPMKLMFSMNFLSLGGIPPFLGFFPKWIAIQGLIEVNLIFTVFLMVILTLIPLYFYIRLILTSLTISNSVINLQLNYPLSTLMMVMNIISCMGLILCTSLFNSL